MKVHRPVHQGRHPVGLRVRCIAVTLMFLRACPVMAQDPTVHPEISGRFVSLSGARTYELMQDCERAPAGEITTCGGYIVGVFDALSAVGEVCRPEGAEAADGFLISKVRDALAAEPAEWSKNPALLIRDALQGLWPCAVGQRSGSSEPFAPSTTLSLEQIMRAKGAQQ